MIRNNEGGMELTDAEVHAVARMLVAEAIASLDWEDLPELSERSWLRVSSSIDGMRDLLVAEARNFVLAPFRAMEALRARATVARPRKRGIAASMHEAYGRWYVITPKEQQ